MAKDSRPSARPRAAEGNPHAEPTPAPNGRFPVVVVGASAGGLKPLSEFLAAVAEDSGMAYLVIQHRSSDSDSLLTHLLGREARIDVVQATQDQKLEPNRAYVMPPECYASVAGGVFDLVEQPAKHRLPIDFLLRSAADPLGARAIAVILSGTGTDGSLGARAVKAEGGLIVVQEPGTAEYPGMPESAIATEQVDFVLAAADIPACLIEYVQQASGLIQATTTDTDTEQKPAKEPGEVQQILALLRQRRGHDFSLYKPSTVIRRIERRMAVRHLGADYRRYVALLRDEPDEADTLFRELLIRVSGFFRDPKAFAALEEKVIPKLVERQEPEHPIRVWVPGCAPGEEAYSIAILLGEEIPRRESHGEVQIFATDIDPESLEIARSGRYPASIALDVSEARLARYFHGSDNHYVVNKSIRAMLVFAEQSLIKDPPFSAVGLVSCRNLLIYLKPDLQKKAYDLFQYALHPGGFLFLGTSESIAEGGGTFQPLDRKAKIFVRRGESRPRLQALPPAAHASRPEQAPARGGSSGRPAAGIVEVAERELLRDHVPACVMIDGRNHIVYFRGRTGRFLEPETGASSLDIMRMVRQELARDLRIVIRRARRGAGPALGEVSELKGDGGEGLVRLRATAVTDSQAPEGSLLVAFEEIDPGHLTPRNDGAPPSSDENARILMLERELDETRADLRATIDELETSNEELQSANEELQSSNEELQSSNEELETSREELQSVNEELHTLNGELEFKVEELSTAHDDINNLLASIDIGIIFLDLELRIKRFTPPIQGVIPLIDADVGRPLSHFASDLVPGGLSREVEQVMHTRANLERTVQGKDGRWYLMRIRPYWTSRDRILGAIVAFIDFSGDPELASLTWLRAALGRCPGMALLTDLSGRIEHANEAFSRGTGFDDDELSGTSVLALAEDLSAEDEKAMRASLLEANTWIGEFRCRRKPGDAIRVAAVFVPVCAAEEKISHAIVYLNHLA